MYGSRNEYDRGVNTFSPEGRLFQIEYALGAVKLGSTSIAIKTNEGVVMVTERRIQSKLMEPKADAEKLKEIDTHIGCTSSGIIADARIMIDRVRTEAQHHFFTYNEKIPVESCVNTVVDMTLEFSGVHETKKKSIGRPFGAALLIAGVDDDGPSLWCVDPSGTATRYEAVAIGSAQEGAEILLQEKYNASLTLKEAEEVALTILRQVIEEKLTPYNIEMGCVLTSNQRFRIYTSNEIVEIVERLPNVVTANSTLNDAI